MMMKNKRLIDEFNINTAPEKLSVISDYEVFSDKDLLDELRKKIIENIIDNKIVNILELFFKSNKLSVIINKTISAKSSAVKVYDVGI